MSGTNYPAKLSIDYPDRNLNRLTTFFRIFCAIPIVIILFLLIGAMPSWHEGAWNSAATAGGIVMLPTVFMILFCRKYPRWWFEWNLNLTKFCTRVSTYLYLLTDVYPSTDEEQNVHIDISYPDAQKLNRWLPLIKWFLAIPHYIVLFFLEIAAFVIVIIAWFAILFTGRFPKDMFNFVVDVYRWYLRVAAYAFLLVTDKYPPFSLNP